MTQEREIKLPPLPVYMDSVTPEQFAERIRAWGRAAVEADRQRRGEPVLVGWTVSTTGGGILHASKYTEYEAKRSGYSLPVYRLTSPQPASRTVPSDDDLHQIADQYDESDAFEGGACGFDAIGFARALLSRYGQPAASAEPAAWVAADTLNSPHPTCISSLAYMSQIDHDRGREYVPLAIINHHAAPVAAQAQSSGNPGELDAQDREDAERWRWLRDHAALQWYFTSQTEGVRAWAVMHRQNGRITSYNGTDLDVAIDAARAAGADEENVAIFGE